jgi:plastocyanin
MRWIVATALTAALVFAASAQAGPSTSVVIRHQMRGCHAWSVAGHAYKASQAVRISRGSTIAFTNNDVMRHTLIQTKGAKVTIVHAKMGHMGATATVKFSHAGVYKFKTRFGEDYPGMNSMKTIGEDNVLKLTVRVS